MCSIILETDANVIAGKVASHSMDAGAPLSEQVLWPLFLKQATLILFHSSSDHIPHKTEVNCFISEISVTNATVLTRLVLCRP